MFLNSASFFSGFKFIFVYLRKVHVRLAKSWAGKEIGDVKSEFTKLQNEYRKMIEHIW